MVTYRPVIPPSVADRIGHLPPDVKRGIKQAIRAIGVDPARGEPLERELGGYRKYRVRRFRIVYQLDRAVRTVRILAVGHRRTIYDEVVEQIRAGQQQRRLQALTSPAASPPAARRSSRRRAARHR